MDLTELIASMVEDRVLVFGSLPPHGRDLDLLVRPREHERLAAGLEDRGFERRGRIWARFRGCGVDVVELAPASSWPLATGELEAVFAQAIPLDPSGKVCKPAPHHALLILAGRAMRDGPELLQRRRDRIDVELADDAHAFEAARQRAPMWRASRALSALEHAYRLHARIPSRTRRRAVAEQLAGPGAWAKAQLGAWRAVLHRPRRGAVIAFSGLDGAGKSSQAWHLAETLDRLGFDALVAWTSVAAHPRWMTVIANVPKRVLRVVARGGGRPAVADPGPGAPRGSDDPVKALRSRSTVLTFAWSLLVSLRVALELVRVIWPPLLRGTVVICDRYELDTCAHLHYQYGEDRSFRPQFAIIRLASPRPRLAYLLDVSALTASRRKADFTVERNVRRARIYREKAAELDVRVIDGERPEDEICAEVAREAWRALS